MIYVNLKEFRTMHGKMKQSELGELLGLSQSVLSSMESSHKPLMDEQYKTLVEKFGEDDVKRYVSDPPFVNALRKGEWQRMKKDIGLQEEQPSVSHLITLVNIISELKNTNAQLEKEIESLRTEIKRLKE